MGTGPSSENLESESGCGHFESLEPKSSDSLRVHKSDQPHADESLGREHGDEKEGSRKHMMGIEPSSENLESEI